MRIVIFILSLLLSLESFSAECVILIHGLARTHNSMRVIKKSLEKEGYEVNSLSYPSTSYKIEYLADKYIPRALNRCEGYEKVHFVTHSMGGILVRYFMKMNQLPENLGHVVMLAPPNKGSVIVDKLKDTYTFNFWHGPAGKQLGTDKDSVPNSLGPVDYSVGVIAGDKESLVLSNYFDEPNDGKVSVESSKVEGMSDHIVMDASHTYIMRNRKVIKQIKAFLKEGMFN